MNVTIKLLDWLTAHAGVVAACSGVVAIYAAIVATYVAVVDRRPWLKIKGYTEADGEPETWAFMWRIVNRGRILVAIDQCGVLFPGHPNKPLALVKQNQLLWVRQVLEDAAPCEVAPHHRVLTGGFWKEIADALAAKGFAGDVKVTPICEDETGRRYKGPIAVITLRDIRGE